MAVENETSRLTTKTFYVFLLVGVRLNECVCTLAGDQWHKESSEKLICITLHSRRLNNDCLMRERTLCCTLCVCAALMRGKYRNKEKSDETISRHATVGQLEMGR